MSLVTIFNKLSKRLINANIIDRYTFRPGRTSGNKTHHYFKAVILYFQVL